MVDKSPEAFRTISEVGIDLNIPQHVLRFWETRFSQIKPLKRSGGRRYYRPEDVDLIRAIQQLLYGQGYTIRGVQRILKEQGVRTLIAQAQNLHGEVIIAPRTEHAAGLEHESEDDTAPDHDMALDGAELPLGLEQTRLSYEDAHRLKAALFEIDEGVAMLRRALAE